MKQSFYIDKTQRRGLFPVLGCLFVLMALSGCGQEPLFYHISYEEAPVDPFIQGGPRKIAADEEKDHLYVSNNRIFKYTSTTKSWSALGGEPGKVFDVTLTETGEKDTLYAITDAGGLWKQDTASWTQITNNTGYSSLQSIFGAGEYLFVGARRYGSSSDHAILFYKEGAALSLLSQVNGSLSGAVEIGGKYYLATGGDGIIEVTAIQPNMTLPSPLTGTAGKTIMGLLKVDNNTLAAAERDGTIFYGTPPNLKPFSYGVRFTGAFALWENPDDKTKRLFLAGIRGGSSSHGYREIPLLNTGDLGAIRAPGEGAAGWTTVSNTAKYNSSLEKQALNSIFVAKEVSTEGNLKYPVIFASTQKSGLWVYRNGSWKAQE